MSRDNIILIGVVLAFSALASSACSIEGLPNLSNPTGLVAKIASKAEAVARQTGSPGGFGGKIMDGYAGRMPMHIGFHDETALAEPGSFVMVGMVNASSQDCVFHLSHVSSQMGASEHTMEVSAPAGGSVTVQILCPEILGMGPMEMPGQPGCHLADGQPVVNTMAVPGFMGMDYSCGDEFMFRLMTDVNDLDHDGDRQELIIMSQAMEQFMQSGFPMGIGQMMGR